MLISCGRLGFRGFSMVIHANKGQKLISQPKITWKSGITCDSTPPGSKFAFTSFDMLINGSHVGLRGVAMVIHAYKGQK